MQKSRKRNWIMYGMLALGAAFVLLGIFQDEVRIVLLKAVKICLECIGIG